MSKTLTYKAVAYEYSHGDEYHQGKGVCFSNSIKVAVELAKERAFAALGEAETAAHDSGVSILATVEVFKGSKKVYDESY